MEKVWNLMLGTDLPFASFVLSHIAWSHTSYFYILIHHQLCMLNSSGDDEEKICTQQNKDNATDYLFLCFFFVYLKSKE